MKKFYNLGVRLFYFNSTFAIVWFSLSEPLPRDAMDWYVVVSFWDNSL